MIRKFAITILLIVMIGYAFYSAYEKRQDKIAMEKRQSELVSKTSAYGLEKNKLAPDFNLKNINGKDISLSSLKGKTVILNFWATWCPPCKKEIPDLVSFQEKIPKDVELISINLTHAEQTDLQGIRDYMNDLGMNYPVLLDNDGKITEKYRVISIPTTYIIGKNGIITKKHLGPLTKEQLIELLK